MIYCFSSVFSLVSFFSDSLLSSFTESSSSFSATLSALSFLSVPAKRLIRKKSYIQAVMDFPVTGESREVEGEGCRKRQMVFRIIQK